MNYKLETSIRSGHLTVLVCPFCGFTASLRSDTARPNNTHYCSEFSGGVVYLNEVTDPLFKMAIAKKDGV